MRCINSNLSIIRLTSLFVGATSKSFNIQGISCFYLKIKKVTNFTCLN